MIEIIPASNNNPLPNRQANTDSYRERNPKSACGCNSSHNQHINESAYQRLTGLLLFALLVLLVLNQVKQLRS